MNEKKIEQHMTKMDTKLGEEGKANREGPFPRHVPMYQLSVAHERETRPRPLSESKDIVLETKTHTGQREAKINICL